MKQMKQGSKKPQTPKQHVRVVFDRLEFFEVYRVFRDDGKIEELRITADNGAPHVLIGDSALSALSALVTNRAAAIRQAILTRAAPVEPPAGATTPASPLPGARDVA